MKKILYKFLSFINFVISKKDIIVFNSFPDLSGNSIALYEYILKKRPDIVNGYKLIWSVSSDIKECNELLVSRTGVPKHRLVQKRSFKGIYYYFISKYIVSTHGFFPFIQTSADQTHLNLWHGMPFKRIGRMLEEVHNNGKSDEADMTIATSSVFQEIMAKSFGLDDSKVLVTGQPCNDYLFEKKYYLGKFGIEKREFKKIIVWMPTYRKSVVGDIRQDGKLDSFGVSNVLSERFDDFNELLKIKNYLLIIKPHPMDVINDIKFPESENIVTIRNDDLSQKHVQLYELLSECDILMTDYSSVFIDFMITGKPLVFVCDDIKEYGSSRGFCFNLPENYMPGEFINDYQKLVNYINDMEQLNEKWQRKYKLVQKEFHLFCDNDSSKRVCDEVFGHIGE